MTTLHVSSVELGLLGAMQWLPFLLLSLPLGVMIDRHRRRRLLVASEIGRTLLTLCLVGVTAVGMLGFPLLAVVLVLLGACTVVYEIGYQSMIPSLVPRERLSGANSRFQGTAAAGEIGGPGLGGALLQLTGAAVTLGVNAGLHLISAIALTGIRSAETVPAAGRRDFLRELRDGSGHVLKDPYLRANVGFSALYNPFAQWVTLLLVLYAARDLHLEEGHVGLVFAVGVAGALVGAALASPLSRRPRVGLVLIACASVECAALLFLPLVDGSLGVGVTVGLIAAAMALNGLGVAASSVLLITIRQLRTPDRLLGRVNATMRTITYGTIPIGALAGGIAGEWLGARTGLLIGAVLCLSTVVWVAVSPLRRVSRLTDLAVSEGAIGEVDPAGRGSS
ncbi:MFS transporter [Microbacterium marinilacus]|uniref:MFS transporter n=1 Tax=Microbacterium marinilacus TaxID=415209 RepID=A0ABP7BHZ2_9MICO|nr:MFS transporter [Microbacterium marinilacus]MBY0687631.1 MFS transporter [Microbacterium marinilacus]